MSKSPSISWSNSRHSAIFAHIHIHIDVLNGLLHFERLILMGTLNLTSKKLKCGILDAIIGVINQGTKVYAVPEWQSLGLHFKSKREVPKDVRNSKVRKQDKFRRDWSRH